MTHKHDPFEPILDGLPVPGDVAGLHARDSLEVLLSQFADEVRNGHAPSIDDYAARYPACADEIRELFPLVASLESWKDNKEVECLRRNVPDEIEVDAFGDYKVIGELGRGGMGVVFYAVHHRTLRPVAVKLLPWRYAANMPRWKERFHREASTIAALRHKNIVQVYSFGRHEGYYYYVMQYIDGVGLDRIIAKIRSSSRPCVLSDLVEDMHPNNPLAGTPHDTSHHGTLTLMKDSWRGFARLGEQIARALSHAHRHDVLHNDIKPSNLLVKANGHVTVTDFGIRTLNDDGTGLVDRDDGAVGTLRYTAPESLRGQNDARCDVYSLGITLYELVTQVVPFAALNRADLMDRVLHHELKRPSELAPQIPEPLETILLKATAKDPNERYDSATAFADDLRRFINGTRIKARRKTMLQKTIAWMRASNWFGATPGSR
jgi:serine/threonine protein kinase